MANKVLKPFIDKHTGKGYNDGSTFVSDDTERVAFLVESGFLEPKREQLKNDVTTPDALKTLKEEAKALKIKNYGKMDEAQLKTAIEEAKASD